MVVVERGGHADDDRIHFSDVGVVGCGVEAGLLRGLNGARQDADDVRAAGVEDAYLVLGDIEAGDAEFFTAEEEGEREADIAHSDDADAGFAGLHFELEAGCAVGGGEGHYLDCRARSLELERDGSPFSSIRRRASPGAY